MARYRRWTQSASNIAYNFPLGFRSSWEPWLPSFGLPRGRWRLLACGFLLATFASFARFQGTSSDAASRSQPICGRSCCTSLAPRKWVPYTYRPPGRTRVGEDLFDSLKFPIRLALRDPELLRRLFQGGLFIERFGLHQLAHALGDVFVCWVRLVNGIEFSYE